MEELEKCFRVWLFNRHEGDNSSWSRDGYDSNDYTITYDIQGAEYSDVTEQELVDLRAGLQKYSYVNSKAILVRDLRKQAEGEYIKIISDLIRAGAACRETARLEQARKDRQAELRKKKSQQDQMEKKKKQLEKLKLELAELES
jgi:hypothetical protein